ncbi:tyrosine-type recombinase/integrase [Thermodesulfobacteriota bacterium]
MPRRKHKQKQGKHGPIIKVAPGVIVRQDARDKILLWINKGGKRYNKTFGVGRDALDEAIEAAELIAEKLEGFKPVESMPVNESNVPYFKNYSYQWLNSLVGSHSKFTIERYDEILRLHVFTDEAFQNIRIDQVTRKLIKDFLRRLLKRRSASMVETTYSVLSGIFEEAIDDEYVEANPVRGLLGKVLPSKAKRRKSPPDPFSMDERDRFLARAQEICTRPLWVILLVMAFTGLRLGEALALRLRHIDFAGRTLTISETFKRGIFGSTKTGKIRKVDMPDILVDILREYAVRLRNEMLRHDNGEENDLLFPDPELRNRKPYSQRKIQSTVKKVCKLAGLRVRNPHDLRHTYATILLMAHQSPAYVQKQLGHSSIKTTVDIYGHWISGEGRGGLDDALGGKIERKKDEKCILLHMRNKKSCNHLRLQQS